MTTFNFATDAAKELWGRSSPKGDAHKVAWSWRESPAAVDRAVTKIVRNMTEEQVKVWLADCMIAAEIQSRYRGEQIKSGEHLGRPKGLAVWLNSGDWASEVGSTSELKKKQVAQICSTQGCGKPVHGDKFQVCQDHLPDSWAADRNRIAIEMDMPRKREESKPDWIGRLRCIARLGGYSG